MLRFQDKIVVLCIYVKRDTSVRQSGNRYTQSLRQWPSGVIPKEVAKLYNLGTSNGRARCMISQSLCSVNASSPSLSRTCCLSFSVP